MTSLYPILDDAFIPMESEDEKALQDHKRKRNEHWMRMRYARSEWMKITGWSQDTVSAEFWIWLEDTYGLRPHKDALGNIDAGYDIVDEKLYTIFLLKFGR